MEERAGRATRQFPLRMPSGLRDRIERSAEESLRSLNSEIIFLLRQGMQVAIKRQMVSEARRLQGDEAAQSLILRIWDHDFRENE